MELDLIFNSKDSKPKEKIETVCKLLVDKKVSIDELIVFAKTSKDPVKASCIEAMEFATKGNPEFATLACLNFVSSALTEKAPRVKWESAKVIGNIAHLFSEKLDTAIVNLLTNTEHTGTVVRWSAAFALSQIIQTTRKNNKDLIAAMEQICEREEKKSIKKIYLDAFKKLKK